MTTIHVFAGPTVNHQCVRAILPSARVHPPVGHGDLYRLAPDRDDILVVIDGSFLQRPAVRHQEIMWAAGTGCLVLGCSSMGALRAAELVGYGMVGFGHVYRQYATGAIVNDDEVVVAHGDSEAGFQPYTTALVSIRHAVDDALDHGLLTARGRDAVIAAATGLYFPARSWTAVLAQAGHLGADPAELARLRDFVRRTDPDIKRADAEALLRRLRDDANPRDWPDVVAAEPVPETQFQEFARLSYGTQTAGPLGVADLDVIRTVQLLWPSFPGFYRRYCLEQIAGASSGDAPSLAIGAAARRGLRLPSTASAAEALVRTYRRAPGVIPQRECLRILAGTTVVRTAARLAFAAQRHLARAEEFDPTRRVDRVSRDVTRRLLSQQWDGGEVDERQAQLRGFRSVAAAVEALRPLVPYLLSGRPGAAVLLSQLRRAAVSEARDTLCGRD